MKANEALEKIYLEKVYPDNGVLPNGLNYNQSPNDIEYTRTDAFIEKLDCWLHEKGREYYGEFDEGFLIEFMSCEEAIEDFRKYMKGE